MVDQRFDALDEAFGVWQHGVTLKRRFIPPAGVNVEQLGIASGAKDAMTEASRLVARG
jgi:hypothetical protein